MHGWTTILATPPHVATLRTNASLSDAWTHGNVPYQGCSLNGMMARGPKGTLCRDISRNWADATQPGKHWRIATSARLTKQVRSFPMLSRTPPTHPGTPATCGNRECLQVAQAGGGDSLRSPVASRPPQCHPPRGRAPPGAREFPASGAA